MPNQICNNQSNTKNQKQLNLTTTTERGLSTLMSSELDSIEQCFTSPPTQYRLYGRRFLQVKRPNQQYQSTDGTYIVHREIKNTIIKQ